jgi:hypothetical protein
MNKAVTPKQLELTAGKTREELLIQSLPSHIDPESPAFKADRARVEKIEKEEAARAVLAASGPVMGSGYAFGVRDGESFDWDTDEAIVLRSQPATAVYHNNAGHLVIRQERRWDEEMDPVVTISPENAVTFMEALAKRAREG